MEKYKGSNVRIYVDLWVLRNELVGIRDIWNERLKYWEERNLGKKYVNG